MKDVGALDEFEEDACRILELPQGQVAIIRWGREIFALSNRCPHQAGPACEGHLGPLLIEAEPGCISIDSTRPVVACAWHGWEFDVKSGEEVHGGRYRLRSYPVSVRDDRVLIEFSRVRSATQ